MFDVELSLVGDSTSEEAGRLEANSTIILRRDYQEFRALHQSLTSSVASKKKDVPLPPLPLYKNEEYTDADMAEDLAAYIHLLLAITEVTQSKQFLSLLHDHDTVGGTDASATVPENAVDFLLQPCSPSPLYVPRRTKHEQEIEVPAGSTVLWRFTVGDRLDIQCAITFSPDADKAAQGGEVDGGKAITVLAPTRCPMGITTSGGATPGDSSAAGDGGDGAAGSHHPGVLQGLFTAPVDGLCTFTWDNTYSRLRGKQVHYILQVVTEEVMRAAVEAAEEMSRASSRSRSLLKSRIEAGDGGLGKIGVKVLPVARPAMDADSFFNKDDLTVSDENMRGRWSTDSNGNGGGYNNGGEAAAARRSSIGAIWEYLLASSSKAKESKEEGGETDTGLQKVMAEIEKLEDDIAAITAKKEQAEAETIIALAKQRRWSIEKERFERKMNEAVSRVAQQAEQLKSLQAERVELIDTVAKKTQEAEWSAEAAKRADREKDVLLAEKHVWTMAHSGVQQELVKNLAAFEKEKQMHEDTRTALRKAKESIQKLKGEIDTLKGRLEQKVDEKTLQATQGELTAARAELRDLTDAVEEAGAENEHLRGQLRLVAKHAKHQQQEMVALQGELGQLRMYSTSQEKKVVQLKAEKKVLVRELKKAGRGSFDLSMSGGVGRAASFDGDGSVTSATSSARTTPVPAMVAAAEVDATRSLSPPPPPSPPLSTAALSGGAEQGGEQQEEEMASVSQLLGMDGGHDQQQRKKEVQQPSPSPPSPQQPSQGGGGGGGEKGESVPAESELEKDEKYMRLMGQLQNSMERRQQLLALLEEDPGNTHVKDLLTQLEEVLSLLRRRMRALLAAKEQQQKHEGQQSSPPSLPPPAPEGADAASSKEGGRTVP